VSAGKKRKPTIGESFDPKANSLNILRLVFAVAVIASHAIDLGGFGRDWIGTKTTIGTVAVYGFFAISGFLITGSAERNGTGRYLWQRSLRIFPAFWVCLIVTAFGIGLLGWEAQLHQFHLHGNLTTYLHAPNGPIGFVTHNWFLKLGQPLIISTLWNGSLWSLYFEFICYLIVGVLAIIGVLRRPLLLLAMTLATWAVAAVITGASSLNTDDAWKHNYDTTHVLVLVPLFLTGSLLYLYKDRLPDTPWLAAAGVAIFVVSLWLPFGAPTPGDTLTSTSLLAPALVYPVLWLGIHLPLHRLAATNDYSYGMYIYAYPVQVLLAIWGVARWGYGPYLFLSIVGTIPLAVASWWLIERPVLRLKSWSPSRRTAGPVNPDPGRPEESALTGAGGASGPASGSSRGRVQ
jgi:peptidoglycan/LPS O-acetylase OafA/YrhL